MTISPRARAYVRKQASSNMEARCVIWRETDDQKYEVDPVTLRSKVKEGMKLYEGPCRIWETSGRQLVQLGDSDMLVASTNLSIPWDAECLVEGTMIQANDLFRITDHQTDERIIGVTGEIQEAAKAGDLRATKRFAVIVKQPKGGE